MTKIQTKMLRVAGSGAGEGVPPMPAGMENVLGDQEIMKALQNPKMIKAMMELQTGGPAAMTKYESDPEFMQLLMKIQAKMGGGGSGGVAAPPTTMPGMTSGGVNGGVSVTPAPKTGGGGFGFEAFLNDAPTPAVTPRSTSPASSSSPAPAAGETGKGGLEEMLKARIAEVEKKTEKMIDEQVCIFVGLFMECICIL